MKKFSEEKEAKAPCLKNVSEGLQKFFFYKMEKKYVPTHTSIFSKQFILCVFGIVKNYKEKVHHS